MSYILQMADELMTAPIAQIEANYNEAWRRHNNEDEPSKYKKIIKILEQVASNRFYTIIENEGYWEFKPLFRKGK